MGAMMKKSVALIIGLLLLLPGVPGLDACTVFVQDDGQRHYYGSNFDWHSGIGYVTVNPRGLAKKGWVLPDDPGRPLNWTSKYGSVTFVQYGQGLPKGGMNEAGLAIEGLLLSSTEYPPPDNRPYIGSTSHFKQYLLDTCATVADVIERLPLIRVAAYGWAPGIHVMVADETGDCAVIAFLEGRLVVYRGDNLPAKVLTNHVVGLEKPNIDVSYLGSSMSRYQTAAKRVQKYRSAGHAQAVAYAMDTLAEVSAGSYTQWRVVYDQSERVVYWRCAPDEALRWIDLKKIDYSCRLPVTALPVGRIIKGEANRHLALYTAEKNRNLVYQALGHSRDVIPVPEAIWDEVWRWPEKETCAVE